MTELNGWLLIVNGIMLFINLIMTARNDRTRRGMNAMLTFDGAPSICRGCVEECDDDCRCECHARQAAWFMAMWNTLKLKAK